MPAQTPHTGSLRKTLFWEVSALLAFAVTATIIAALFLARGQTRTRAIAQLQSIIHAKEELLSTITGKQREEVAALAKDTDLSHIPTVTNIIGFRNVFLLENDGTTHSLIGQDPEAEIVVSAIAHRKANSTQFVPSLSQSGWNTYSIIAPKSGGKEMEWLVATFFSAPLLHELLSVDELGETTDIMLSAKNGKSLTLLHQVRGNRTISPLDLGSYTDRLADGSVLTKAIEGQEGIEETKDYAGIDVLAAYRSVPSIGWGLVVQIDRHEIEAPMFALAAKLLMIGGVLIILLALVMACFAKRITGPLLILTQKIDKLETRKWLFARSIFTHDELERVDEAAFDLTQRLRLAYDHLEDLVRIRTLALDAQHAQDEAILQTIDYGLIVTDSVGVVTLLNAAAQLLTGWSEADAIGKPCSEVLHIVNQKEQPLAAQSNPITAVIRTGKAYAPIHDPEFSLNRKNGSCMALALRVTPIVRERQFSGTVIIFRDTTEDRRIDRMKSEFISLVSHQLRTPLSSIRWYLEMLLGKDMGPLTQEQQGTIEQIAASNDRMVRLVNALLNVSRIELGTFSPNTDTIDPLTMLKQVEKTIEQQIEKKNLRIAYDTTAYRPIRLQSNAILLQLIIENLLLNAVKYGAEGSTVRIVLTVNPTNKTCSVSVHDTGIGIPPEEQYQVFSKLFRARNAQVSETDGNGLGLYISRIAAESIGAELSFSSTDGETVFCLLLPLIPASANGEKIV